MTEAVIKDYRQTADKTTVQETKNTQEDKARAEPEKKSRVKRSDENDPYFDIDDDGPEGRLMVDPDDDHDDGMVDIDDDAPYEDVQSPDDHDELTVDPNDVAEQTEDAGEHDDDDHPHDDDDTNAVVDVSDDIDPDDLADHEVLPPVREITVHKQTIPAKKAPKDPQYSYHIRNAPKESVLFKVRHTDHSTVTKPKAKLSRFRHQDKYDINWDRRHKEPTYDISSQQSIARSHSPSPKFQSPQTLHDFFAKESPVSSENVNHRTKFLVKDKTRTDVKYSRSTPSVKKKESSKISFDESYSSRGVTPPRWSSSYIRFEEPDSPFATGGQGLDDHRPADEHPKEEIAQPTVPTLALTTTPPAVLSTPSYNPVWFPYRSLSPAMTKVYPIKTIHLPTVRARTQLSPSHVVDLIRKYPIRIKISESR